jgi:hypothetical protein
MNKKTISAVVGLTLAAGPASALDYDFYGSFRVHAESVNPDITDTLDSYTDWRDAYSRLGVNISQAFGSDGSNNVYAKLELPLDIPNAAVQDPWDQDEDIRIAKIGLSGSFGDVAIGQMWLPYYNAIAYPVDMFSSYYSGFATYSVFRRGDTMAYYTPKFGGFSGSVGYSDEKGALEANGERDHRLQATLSYDFGELSLSGGLDHLGGENNWKTWGTSVAWQTTDALYIGAKYEIHDTDIDSGYGKDGDTAMNFYAGYTLGKHTFKGMIADVDGYGEGILHLGYDFQWLKDLKLFAEYYSEEETAAITTEGGGLNETCWDCSGGYVFAAGVRFDFSASGSR